MEWNVNFKLKRIKYCDDDNPFKISVIKDEIISWLEDLDYEVDNLNIEERE